MSYASKILIVDDEPHACESLKVFLSNQGYETQTCYNGKEAIELLARASFDLVLLDIMMPDISGFHVMDYINSQKPKPLVIVITGHATVASAVESLRKGACDYLTKPYDFIQLIDGVENALEQSRLKKEHEIVDRKLRQAESQYRLLVNASPDLVYILNHEGEFTFVNAAVERLLGYKQSRLFGKHYSSIVSEEDIDKAKYHFNERRTGARATRCMELRLKHFQNNGAPNKFLTVELVAMGMYDRPVDQIDKELMGTYGVARDIAHRKLHEPQLLQAQKMEAIGTLAGGIAHNFNNLLMVIQGSVSLMLMEMDSTHPYYVRLKNIEKQVQSGAELTSRLIGYARMGKYEVKTVDLNHLVREASDTFGRTKKEITIHLELDKDLYAIEADVAQVQQVLFNLFVNAADAMPGGGDLILKTMNTTHESLKGKLYDPKPGNYALLTITDTGIGMGKHTIEHIFDPFFTTKEMGRGTGLGLASVYGIIKGHGGYIDVESKKGHGTTFSIFLPAPEKPPLKVVETANPSIKGAGTILLVDDEETVLESGQDFLEAMDYRVFLARDGKEAIEVYRKNQDDIDIVILDIVMPDMNGGEAYDRMKEINPGLKVLLSSGNRIDRQATDILERGCDGFIRKPFSIRELFGKIREILKKE